MLLLTLEFILSAFGPFLSSGKIEPATRYTTQASTEDPYYIQEHSSTSRNTSSSLLTNLCICSPRS